MNGIPCGGYCSIVQYTAVYCRLDGILVIGGLTSFKCLKCFFSLCFCLVLFLLLLPQEQSAIKLQEEKKKRKEMEERLREEVRKKG